MATQTRSRNANPAAGVETTFKRRVFVNKVFKGIFTFQKGTNADKIVREKIAAKYGQDAANQCTVVVAKLKEEGSTMPDEFKGAQKNTPKTDPDAQVEESVGNVE